MSQFPITPQQDYQTIYSTTGKGYKQSIAKNQIVVPNPLLVGGYLSNIPSSGSFFTSDGTTVTLTKPLSTLDLSLTFSANSSLFSYYIALLRLNIGGVLKDYTDYPAIRGGTAVKDTWRKLVYESMAPGDFFSLFIGNSGTVLTNITIENFTVTVP